MLNSCFAFQYIVFFIKGLLTLVSFQEWMYGVVHLNLTHSSWIFNSLCMHSFDRPLHCAPFLYSYAGDTHSPHNALMHQNCVCVDCLYERRRTRITLCCPTCSCASLQASSLCFKIPSSTRGLRQSLCLVILVVSFWWVTSVIMTKKSR